jgi:acetyl-CoA C-acetyltransferase
MTKKSFPIIVGAAQFKQDKNVSQPLDPLNLMVKTSQMAIVDTTTEKIKDYIDTVFMTNISSWSYEDAPSDLSKILGINPSKKVYTTPLGNVPQAFVNRAAKAIFSGERQAVLITGGEAAYSSNNARKGKINLNWPEIRPPKYMEGNLTEGTTKFEKKYGLRSAPCAYALFETAIRAASGRSIEEHRKYMGKLFEHFSSIAAKNPYAWIQKCYTPDEITIPSMENRNVNYPYTKRMCANFFVDQSGALLMTNEEIAEKLGINRKLWIYPMGGADLKNIQHITQRQRYDESPAARFGPKLALEQAGLSLEDINQFDIYSCFPSVVQIIRKELGLSEDDPRDISIAGGLPYFGGPLSNYSLHAIITTVNLIREDPSKRIMIIANGGYNTKQSFGIYGTTPPVKSWGTNDEKAIQETILAETLPEPVEEANGQLTVDAYTIYYERDGTPKRGIVLGHLENRRNTLAYIKAKPEQLKNLEQTDLVGQIFPIHFNSKLDRNQISLD